MKFHVAIEVVSAYSSLDKFYYHHDHQGSVVAISDQNRNIVQTYTYDARGNIIANDINHWYDLKLPRYKAGLQNHRLYTGREYEPELGLYYYRNRYYSPTLGKFISQDPLLYVDGPNPYTYVNNNPVNYVDPWGLEKNLLQKGMQRAGEGLTWASDKRNSVPQGIRGRIEGLGQAGLGALTAVWGAGEVIVGGVSCPFTGGVGCGAAALGVSDVVGGVHDTLLGLRSTLTSKTNNGGFYPIDEGIQATLGNSTVGVVAMTAVNIDPRGLVKGVKKGVKSLIKNAKKLP